MKKVLVFSLALAFAVSASFAQNATNKVKSKRGDINLVSAAGGSQVVCAASFNDEMPIIKTDGGYTLVKGLCGQGWVNNADVERVSEGSANKVFSIDAVSVTGWIDNPSAMVVFNTDVNDFEGINIDRNFSDYLKNTADREQTEMRNHEN